MARTASTPAAGSFGIYVDSNSFDRESYTQDGLNTNIPHAARIYPAKDRAGTLVPNTYLVAFEDAQNGDYQDYVFEVSNVGSGRHGVHRHAGGPDRLPAGGRRRVAAGYTARQRRGIHHGQRIRLGRPRPRHPTGHDGADP